MGIFSWLFEGEEPKKQAEKKPETLVFGAELRCPCGFRHSFLIVPTDNLNTDNLPSAHVWDSKAFVNIDPFGTCTLGLECEQMIELEDRWENIEPQNVLMGNDEVITMKSTLTCRKSGQWIVPVNSGQDGQAAARILREAALTSEMKQKYPGLLEILKDPYGSLYLHDGMCENAIQFLEDSLKRNGDMEMASLYGEYDMEGQLIRSALGHLLVTCDVSRLELFVEGLSTRGVINGMEEVPGWDARILNEEMLEMVRREYPETAERIETKSYYRWQEEHKKALSVLGQMSMELANGLMFYECMIAEKPYLERIERERAYRATKEAGGETAKGSGGDGNGETGEVVTGESEGGTPTSLRDLMTPEETARYDAYWKNVADDMLKSNINSYRQAILNGDIIKPTGGKINSKVVTAAIDTNTGDTYYGISGMNNNPTRNAINPQMQAILDSVDGTMTNYPLENCGEFNAINNALNSVC